MNYTRVVAIGRLPFIQLESTLQTGTCRGNEPILGFAPNPTINSLPTYTANSKWEFTPTSHTCTFMIDLPIRSSASSLPSETNLIEIYSTPLSDAYLQTG